MEHIVTFELFEASVNYAPLQFKTTEFMGADFYTGDGVDKQNDILSSKKDKSGKIADLVAFFNERADLSVLAKYMPKGGSLGGYCKYLVDGHENEEGGMFANAD